MKIQRPNIKTNDELVRMSRYAAKGRAGFALSGYSPQTAWKGLLLFRGYVLKHKHRRQVAVQVIVVVRGRYSSTVWLLEARTWDTLASPTYQKRT
jgi:hypothetical protein